LRPGYNLLSPALKAPGIQNFTQTYKLENIQRIKAGGSMMQHYTCDFCGKPLTSEKIAVMTKLGELYVCEECNVFEDDFAGSFGGSELR
jgi:ribosomal protein L37AE/L43A